MQIINTEECVPDGASWLSKCNDKTVMYIILKIILLAIEIIWYNIYTIVGVTFIVTLVYKIYQRTSQNQNTRQQPQRPTQNQNQQYPAQHQLTHVQINTTTIEPNSSQQNNNRQIRQNNIKPVNQSRANRRRSVTFSETNQSPNYSSLESDTSISQDEINDPLYRPNQNRQTRGRSRRNNNVNNPKRQQKNLQRQQQSQWEQDNDTDSTRQTRSSSRRNSIADNPNNNITNDSIQNQNVTRYIHINAPTPINTPPPPKFTQVQEVNNWIREMEAFISVGNYEGRKKNVY